MELIILLAAAAVIGFLVYTSLNKKSSRHPLDSVTTAKTEVPTIVETAPVIIESVAIEAKPEKKSKETKVKAAPKKPAAPKKSAPTKKTTAPKKSAPAKKTSKTKK